MQQALQLIPRAVVLAPQEYEAILEQIAQLKRQLRPVKPELPSSCRVTGRVENGLAHVHAVFELVTSRPNTWVNLGCQRAWPTDASLDGQLPSLQPCDNGYMVHIDRPGTHKAVLDLLLRASSKKGEGSADQGFELDLPHSAISVLDEFDLPPGSTDVKLGTQLVQANVAPERTRIASVPITAANGLELTWTARKPQVAKIPLVTAAVGRLVVRVDTAYIITDAEVTLQVLGGSASEWQLHLPVPAGASFEGRVDPQDESRVQSLTRSENGPRATVTVRLKIASSDPVRTLFQIRQPRQGGPISIAAPHLAEAVSERGEVEIQAPENVRLHYELGGTIRQRSVGDDQRRQGVRAAFSYWSVPVSGSQENRGLLTLKAETVKGAVETRVTHSLRMTRTGASDPMFELRTRFDVTPVRAAVEHLQLALPADYHYDKSEGPTPVDLIEDLSIDSAEQMAVVKLAHRQTRPFSITIAGSYPVAKGQEQVSVQVPRILAWGSEQDQPANGSSVSADRKPIIYDRGGQVKVTIPESLELTARQFRPSGEAPLQSFLLPLRSKMGIRDYVWQGERAPERIDLNWREYRPELSVHGIVDVVLIERQARIRHRLKFIGPQSGLAQAILRIPPGLEGKVRIIGGATLQRPQDNNPGELAANFARPASREQEVELEYILALPQWVEAEASVRVPPPSPAAVAVRKRMIRRFAIQLVQPVQATQGDTKVRLWCDWGDQPAVSGEEWEELPIEIVPDRDSLPALVVQGGLDRALPLSLTRMPTASSTSALVERVLVRVEVTEAGLQHYRSRFLLNQLNTGVLDIDLSTLLPRSAIEARLGSTAVPFQLIDELGREVDIGKRARLSVQPHLVHTPVVLDLHYVVDASRAEGNGFMQSTFRPPEIQSALLVGRLRWDIHFPAGWIVVHASPPATVEQRWAWSGWLPSPQPALSSSALEQWIQNLERTLPNAGPESGISAWQTEPEPLHLVKLPQRFWLLSCSLLTMGLAFLLLFAGLSRWVFWSLLCALGLAAGATELLWPGLVSLMAYGSLPGIVVLALVVAVYGVLRHRQRRRVVLMPGFTRVKTGSSLNRANEIAKPREAPPAPEPPKRASSVSSKVGA
jgi:hypothetical protein